MDDMFGALRAQWEAFAAPRLPRAEMVHLQAGEIALLSLGQRKVANASDTLPIRTRPPRLLALVGACDDHFSGLGRSEQHGR